MFKVRFKERLFIIFFACFLAIYPPTVKYQEVQALEWAIPTVAFDTALKFLLGLLGVSITSKALHDNVDWNQVQQDAMNYQIQKGNDAVAVGEWWEDVAKGTLNQASSCWSAFKEWVQSELFTTSASAVYTGSLSSLVSALGFEYTGNDVEINSALLWYSISGNQLYLYFYQDSVASDFTYTVSSSGVITAIRSKRLTLYSYAYNSLSSSVGKENSGGPLIVDGIYNINSDIYVLNLDSLGLTGYSSYYHEFAFEKNDGLFDSANENIQDTAITTDDTTTTAIPDTLPLPWDNVSDTAEGVSDAIDAVQELVAEGVISLEEYWERVQEMLNALAIDTTTEETLPVSRDPDTGETEKLPDKVEENVSNVAFTLNGLEKVFPFCIPWDIYAFVTLLVAEPVAPVINYPIYNPVTNEDINISIDFSKWQTVVVLFRYILDFLLIIGLLLLARQLSGAGGDD